MSDVENDPAKPKLRPANENDWYCLATLFGEQPVGDIDNELAEKNRRAWNRWVQAHPTRYCRCQPLSAEEHKGFVEAFKERTGRLNIPKSDKDGIFSFDFSYILFDRRVGFDGFLFPGVVNFKFATFSEIVDFDSALFWDGAEFSNATFSDIVTFNSANFSGDAVFQSSTFLQDAQIRSGTFSRDADFTGASFRDYADFNSGTFLGLADFTGVCFREYSDFGSANFSQLADFESVSFLDVANFNNGSFNGRTVFTYARFNKVPDFRGRKMHEATEWHGVEWPQPPRTKVDAQSQVYAYERLKQEMERLNKHGAEQFFFRQELRATRLLHRPFSENYFLNFIYAALSNYGDSIILPLVWITVSALIGFLIFQGTPVYNGGHLSRADALVLSISNIFSFLPITRGMTNIPFSDLETWAKLLSIAQSFFSAILFFLLGLALRNRFRMK